MPVRDITTSLQDQVLDAVRAGQDAAVDALRTVADTIRPITRDLDLPDLPFAAELPKPRDLVDDAYGFAQKLLESQRDFMRNAFSALDHASTNGSASHGAKA